MKAKAPGKWIPHPATFGARLRAVRVELHLSAREVGELIDVPAPTLVTWEKGAQPRGVSQAEVALRYERAFNVDRDWLLYGRSAAGDKIVFGRLARTA